MAIKQTPFVDEFRHQLVDSLFEQYELVKRSRRPVWVSLEAESGWGKTRLIQEFYSRLATTQTSQYWPKTLFAAPEQAPARIETRRKRIHPGTENFNREADSLPDYLYWGINCAERSGLPSQVLLDDLQQLKAHLPFILYKARLSFDGQISAAASAIKSLSLDDITNRFEGVAISAIEELAAGLPLGNLVLKAVNKLFATSRQVAKEHQSVSEQGLQNDSGTDTLEQAFELVTSVLHHGMPMVICVEDLHLATSSTLRLFEKLLQQIDAPLLLITTTWPGRVERIEQLSTSVPELEQKRQLIRYSTSPEVNGAHRLEELNNTAQKELIKSYFPSCADDLLEKICQHYTNPLTIDFLCSLKRCVGKENRPYPLKPETVSKLPKTVEAWCLNAWQGMDDDSQLSLIYSVLAIPEQMRTWAPKLVCDSLDRNIPYAKKIRQEVDGWVTYRSESESFFSDEVMRKIALNNIDDFLDEDDQDEFYAALFQKCLTWKAEIRWQEDTSDYMTHTQFTDNARIIHHIDSLLYTLYQKGFGKNRTTAIKEAMFNLLIADFSEDRSYSDFAQQLLSQLYLLFKQSPLIHTRKTLQLNDIELWFLYRYFDFYKQNSTLEEFIQISNDIIDYLTSLLGADNHATREVKRVYIDALLETHAYPQALQALLAESDQLTFPTINEEELETLDGQNAAKMFRQFNQQAAEKIQHSYKIYQAALRLEQHRAQSEAHALWRSEVFQLLCSLCQLERVLETVNLKTLLAIRTEILDEFFLTSMLQEYVMTIEERKVIDEKIQLVKSFSAQRLTSCFEEPSLSVTDQTTTLSIAADLVEQLLDAQLVELAHHYTNAVSDRVNQWLAEYPLARTKAVNIAQLTLRTVLVDIYIAQHDIDAAMEETKAVKTEFDQLDKEASVEICKLELRIVRQFSQLAHLAEADETLLEALNAKMSQLVERTMQLMLEEYSANSAYSAYLYEINRLL
ncbi:hypothetical protein [Vibrio sp. CAU 1672]|uniref:hypothetical protein n=1 Tax=Vibrio sp. CAU 1672 TaxID=3032594 RepID=UPI0023D99C55|nr:hypothetical protein [Vibrio sp. CAU 1672]MDF2155750.1 hypothetical protein [Vibrio sp. CAU 1672]